MDDYGRQITNTGGFELFAWPILTDAKLPDALPFAADDLDAAKAEAMLYAQGLADKVYSVRVWDSASCDWAYALLRDKDGWYSVSVL